MNKQTLDSKFLKTVYPNMSEEVINIILEAVEESDLLRKERDELKEALNNLLDGIESSSIETLNGKNSREMPHDPDEAFVYGAHIFFKLIGDSYPKARKALSETTNGGEGK